jgi:hypothetical protein
MSGAWLAEEPYAEVAEWGSERAVGLRKGLYGSSWF